ncbi:MAG: hypothetical protein IPL84_03100 [Chitinophagaceae bacterium]|nr:hypothetical protein [Chitinophagaceae bacterium]
MIQVDAVLPIVIQFSNNGVNWQFHRYENRGAPAFVYLSNMKKQFCYLVCFFITFHCTAQIDDSLFAKQALAENQTRLYQNLVSNSIQKNLSQPLTGDNEEDWQSAFYAMELINYRTPWTEAKISQAIDSIGRRSPAFQYALVELMYTWQDTTYAKSIHQLLLQTKNNKIFAICAEYLLLCKISPDRILEIAQIVKNKIGAVLEKSDHAILTSLLVRLKSSLPGFEPAETNLQPLFDSAYLAGHVVFYSIQRKNRNYPGLALVKDKKGKFVTDESGDLFSVPQLARSVSNLPGYLTNGNTPQGLYRMDGLGVSKSSFIGPTENIQLSLPNETSRLHFTRGDPNIDTTTDFFWYTDLLPEKLQNYQPLAESFQAGMAGRTEIIAHGSTVDPAFYKNQLFYPFVPTQGCLTSKEVWSKLTGKRIQSDQQQLINAVKKAGGADGYCMVIEIDDQQRPVTVADILPFLKQ